VKHIYTNTPPYTLKTKHYTWSDVSGEFGFIFHSNNVEKTKTKIISDMLLGTCVDCSDYDRVTYSKVNYSSKAIKRIRKHPL